MKKYISYVLLLLPVLLLAGSCEKKNKENQHVQETATLTGTYYVGSDAAGKVYEIASGRSETVLIRALADEGNVSDLTVSISFKADPSAVAAYNKAHGTSYVMSPGSAYEFTTPSVMMPRYGRSSTSAKLKISASGLEDGVTYILPVTIDKVTGTDKWAVSETPQVYILFKQAPPRPGSGTKEDPYNLYTVQDLEFVLRK